MLNAWVVMADHVHGLIGITSPRGRSPTKPSRLYAGSLGAIVGPFKLAGTRRIRRGCVPDFAWQPRFRDRIVPDEAALDCIRAFILANPARWNRRA